jgi:hypothetical protein
MTTLREAAQQALEALENSRVFVTTREKIKHPEGTEWYDERITALRAALAQDEPKGGGNLPPPLQAEPVQEPVAWRYKGMMGMPWSLSDDGYYVSCKRDNGYMVEPLYTHPPRRAIVRAAAEIGSKI